MRYNELIEQTQGKMTKIIAEIMHDDFISNERLKEAGEELLEIVEQLRSS